MSSNFFKKNFLSFQVRNQQGDSLPSDQLLPSTFTNEDSLISKNRINRFLTTTIFKAHVLENMFIASPAKDVELLTQLKSQLVVSLLGNINAKLWILSQKQNLKSSHMATTQVSVIVFTAVKNVQCQKLHCLTYTQKKKEQFLQ